MKIQFFFFDGLKRIDVNFNNENCGKPNNGHVRRRRRGGRRIQRRKLNKEIRKAEDKKLKKFKSSTVDLLEETTSTPASSFSNAHNYFFNGQTKPYENEGLQFHRPSHSWFCKICHIWMGNMHRALLHLKSNTHCTNSLTFTNQSPNCESDCKKKKKRSRKRKKASSSLSSSESDSEKNRRSRSKGNRDGRCHDNKEGSYSRERLRERSRSRVRRSKSRDRRRSRSRDRWRSKSRDRFRRSRSRSRVNRRSRCRFSPALGRLRQRSRSYDRSRRSVSRSRSKSEMEQKTFGETTVIIDTPVMQPQDLAKEGIHMMTVEETSEAAIDKSAQLSMNEPLVFNTSSNVSQQDSHSRDADDDLGKDGQTDTTLDVEKAPSPTPSEKRRRKEELDDLAMLGIDADDLAAQCI